MLLLTKTNNLTLMAGSCKKNCFCDRQIDEYRFPFINMYTTRNIINCLKIIKYYNFLFHELSF